MQLIEERQLAIARNTRIGTTLKVSSRGGCTQRGREQQQLSRDAHQVNPGEKPNTGE